MIQSLVNWRLWSREAFQEAAELQRPVLLVLEQFWCGLSRLLYAVAWNNAAIAEKIEQEFVPVRVDASRRPDVARRFGMGGWPTIAFLTPGASPITGSTFMPPEVLLNALDNVSELFISRQSEVTARADEVQEAQEASRAGRAVAGRSPSPWMMGKIIDILKREADREFGGFGVPPRFPAFDALNLLLGVYRRAGDKSLVEIAAESLDGMMQGGLFDWERGGFFRCSDEPDWSSPRFEKLAEDQARHVQIYLWAHALTGTLEYREAAQALLSYCLDTLYDPALGFFANSQASAADYYRQDELFLDDEPEPPPLDRTLMTDSQCRMASALIFAGGRLENSEMVHRGLKLVDAIADRMWTQPHTVCHYRDGGEEVRGLLADQIEMGLALLDAYQADGDAGRLEHAHELAEMIEERFADPRQPGYFDAEDPLGLGLLMSRDQSYEDNTRLAVFFSRLSRLLGQEIWLARATGALNAFTGAWEHLGAAAGAYGLGLMEVFSEPLTVEIAAIAPDRARASFASAAGAMKEPVMLVKYVGEGDSGARVVSPAGHGRRADTAAELRDRIGEGLSRMAQKPSESGS